MDIAGNRTLSGIFREFAASQPDQTYLIFEDLDGQYEQWTFAQYDRRVNQTAHWLLAVGIKRGESFTYCGMNSPAFVALSIAASRIGAIMVPADYRSTIDELTYLVDHSESGLVVTEPDQLKVTQAAAGNTSCVQEVVVSQCRNASADATTPGGATSGGVTSGGGFEQQVEQQKATPPNVAISADDVVHMLYTSGTTSRPKGVMLTNRALIYGAEVFVRGSGLRNDDRHLITLPVYHAAAQCHAFWPSLVCGASIVLAPRFSPTRFFPLAIRHQCTMAALFSAPLRMLLSQPPDPTWRSNRLRNVTFAIALADAQFAEWHQRFGAPLQHLWGMTETVGLPLMSPLYGPRRLTAAGRPVLGYDLKVIDDAGHEVPPEQPGQIVVAAKPGHTVMKGYFKNPEATEQTLRDGWLHTGDTMSYDEDDFYVFVDRNKDLIKRGGENIAPSEVENVIKQCPGITDAAVVALPDDTYDEVPTAFVIRQADAPIDTEQVLEHCRRKLTKYKVPVAVTFREEFPRTSVGKVQKHLLRKEALEAAT